MSLSFARFHALVLSSIQRFHLVFCALGAAFKTNVTPRISKPARNMDKWRHTKQFFKVMYVSLDPHPLPRVPIGLVLCV